MSYVPLALRSMPVLLLSCDDSVSSTDPDQCDPANASVPLVSVRLSQGQA